VFFLPAEKALVHSLSVLGAILRQEIAMNYLLDDCEEKNKLYPETFALPPREQRYGLQPGDIAKLVFTRCDEPRETEQMWVVVTEVLGEGHYQGELNNYPCVVDAEAGDSCEFKASHVADIFVQQ